MNLRLAALLLCVSLTSCAADKGRLDLPSFRHLDREAVESVDLSFGRMIIGPVSWFIDEDDAEGREIKAILRGIKSVRIRSYSFADDFVYSKRDLDAVRAQLAGSGWSRIVQARERDGEDVDIYVALDGEQTVGFALIASEPREFTILNVVGSIDLDAVQRLRRHFEAEERGDDAMSDSDLESSDREADRGRREATERERYVLANAER